MSDPTPIPDRLVRECSVDDLIDEIHERVSVLAIYAMRYYHFTGADGAPGKGDFHQWHRVKGPGPMALGGAEFLKQRAVAQIHEYERRDLRRVENGDAEKYEDPPAPKGDDTEPAA